MSNVAPNFSEMGATLALNFLVLISNAVYIAAIYYANSENNFFK